MSRQIRKRKNGEEGACLARCFVLRDWTKPKIEDAGVNSRKITSGGRRVTLIFEPSVSVGIEGGADSSLWRAISPSSHFKVPFKTREETPLFILSGTVQLGQVSCNSQGLLKRQFTFC